MTKAAHHLHHSDLPVGGKDDLQQNLALNLKLPSFISVNRPGLECDFSRQGFYYRFGELGFRLGSGYDVGVSETAPANRSARAA